VAPVSAQLRDDAPQKFQCVVKEAVISPDRTLVKCANRGLNGLSEFAAETTQPHAARVAVAMMQALRVGRPLVLTYAPSVELNPEGCHSRTCRKIIDVGEHIATPIALPPRPPNPAEEPGPFDDFGDEPPVEVEPVSIAPEPPVAASTAGTPPAPAFAPMPPTMIAPPQPMAPIAD
jgi:hypothetical protein